MELLISIVIVLIVLGLVVWVVSAYLPIPQPIKNLIIALVVLVVVIWLLFQLTGYRL